MFNNKSWVKTFFEKKPDTCDYIDFHDWFFILEKLHTGEPSLKELEGTYYWEDFFMEGFTPEEALEGHLSHIDS